MLHSAQVSWNGTPVSYGLDPAEANTLKADLNYEVNKIMAICVHMGADLKTGWEKKI